MKTKTTHNHARPERHTLIPLIASAFVLAGVLFLQLGRLGPGNTALGEMSTAGDEFTLLTTDSGNGEFVAVLNNRSGNVHVYEVTSGAGMVLVDLVKMADFEKRQDAAPGN